MTRDPDRQNQLELLDTVRPPRPTTVARYRLELIREADTEYDPETHLSHPSTAASFLQAQIGSRPQEHMAAVYLDTRNRLVGWTIAHIGTINRAAVEPRVLLQTGLLLNACGLILAHNHPSGDPSPSAEDLAFTRRMAEAGELVGVRLVDHLILGHADRWLSLKQRGAL